MSTEQQRRIAMKGGAASARSQRRDEQGQFAGRREGAASGAGGSGGGNSGGGRSSGNR
jgi:hypothetical protein